MGHGWHSPREQRAIDMGFLSKECPATPRVNIAYDASAMIAGTITHETGSPPIIRACEPWTNQPSLF